MDRVSVSCVLLLLCSVSGAELQDNEIIEQRKVRDVTVSEQSHHIPSNFHTALHELSVKLGKHEVRIDQLQTLTQEQNAKLSQCEAKIEQLQTLNQVGQVAFSTSLLTSGQRTFGPFNTDTTLVFTHVISNIGGAYNSNTGFFTAPVRGVYHFELYIHGYSSRSQPTAASLVKNGDRLVSAYEKQTNGPVNPATAATVVLERGETVNVRQWSNSKIFDNAAHHCAFTGHLLFTI